MAWPRMCRMIDGIVVMAIVALLTTALPSGASAADADEIDLEIFNLEELETAPGVTVSGGCSMSLWQHNKVPFKDKFYYVFYRDVLTEAANAQGYIQINGAFVPVSLFAVGGTDHGYDLRDRQVYRGKEGNLWVMIDLTVGKVKGEVVGIDDGSMRVIENGKRQFRVKVKGEAGC